MTFSLDRIPLPGSTGKERWRKSVELERILLQLRALAVAATMRSSAATPTPDEFQMWAKDLRRGRMNVAGSVVRFLDLIERRDMGAEGRRIALEVTELLQQYVDVVLPAAAPAVRPLNTHAVDISSETRAVGLTQYGTLSGRRA